MAKCKKLLLSCLLGGAACIALGAGLILRGGGTPVKADDNFAPAYTGEFNPQYFTHWAISDSQQDQTNEKLDWRAVTVNELSSESSDNDGASLYLNSKSAVVVFPYLPDGHTYTISFKAKGSGTADTISFRCDYYRVTDNERQWYFDEAHITNEWETYTREFNPESSNSNFIVFKATGAVLIDEICLTEKTDTEFNFLPNGSFSPSANLDGYGLNHMATVVAQKDGSAVLLAGENYRTAVVPSGRGYIAVSGMNLPQENAPYTFSLEWQGGSLYSNADAVNIYQGATPLLPTVAGQRVYGWQEASWENVDVSLGFNIHGATTGGTYIRNIQITGADGTEYILNKDLTFKEITYNDGGTETTQERVWGDTEVTAENPTEAGEVFVGWVDSLTEPTEIYRKGSTIQGVTEDKTLYALYADYSMTEGASIWLGGGAEKSGIRWNTTISAEDKAVLDDLKVVYGTRVVSDDDKYADVTITEWCKPAGGRESFNTVLRNITRDGFDTVMEARSYIEITLTNDSEATRIYADVAEGATKRTIAQVAQAAIENGEFADDAEKLAILKEIAGTEVA